MSKEKPSKPLDASPDSVEIRKIVLEEIERDRSFISDILSKAIKIVGVALVVLVAAATIFGIKTFSDITSIAETEAKKQVSDQLSGTDNKNILKKVLQRTLVDYYYVRMNRDRMERLGVNQGDYANEFQLLEIEISDFEQMTTFLTDKETDQATFATTADILSRVRNEELKVRMYDLFLDFIRGKPYDWTFDYPFSQEAIMSSLLNRIREDVKGYEYNTVQNREQAFDKIMTVMKSVLNEKGDKYNSPVRNYALLILKTIGVPNGLRDVLKKIRSDEDVSSTLKENAVNTLAAIFPDDAVVKEDVGNIILKLKTSANLVDVVDALELIANLGDTIMVAPDTLLRGKVHKNARNIYIGQLWEAVISFRDPSMFIGQAYWGDLYVESNTNIEYIDESFTSVFNDYSCNALSELLALKAKSNIESFRKALFRLPFLNENGARMLELSFSDKTQLTMKDDVGPGVMYGYSLAVGLPDKREYAARVYYGVPGPLTEVVGFKQPSFTLHRATERWGRSSRGSF